MKNSNEEVKQASLGSQVEFETGGGEEEGEGEEVEEEVCIGDRWMNKVLQELLLVLFHYSTGFIGPLTLQDILSSKWKKEESNNSIFMSDQTIHEL